MSGSRTRCAVAHVAFWQKKFSSRDLEFNNNGTLVSPCDQNQNFIKDHRQPCWLTPTGKRPRGRPSTRCRDYTSDLAVSRVGVEPAEQSKVAENREVFRVLLGLPPMRSSG